MRTVLVKLSEDLSQGRWVTTDESGAVITQPRQGSTAEALSGAQDKHVIILLPGKWITTHQPVMPATLKGSRLRTAVPFALEDGLSDDLEDCHFALGESQSDHSVPVAIIKRAHMDHLTALLRSHALPTCTVVPDYLTLPFKRGRISVLITDDVASVRFAHSLGFSAPLSALPALLELQLKARDDISRIDCYSEPGALANLQSALTALPCECVMHTNEDTPFDPFALHVQALTTAKTSVNLLQGDYEAIGPLPSNVSSHLRYAGIIAGLCVAMSLLSVATHWYSEHRTSRILDKSIATLYKQAYPNASSIASPRTRIEQELRQYAAGDLHGEFFDILILSGKVIHAHKGATIKRIDYKTGQLQMQLTLESFAKLDTLIKQLKAQSLNVKRDKADSQTGGINAQLTLSIGGKA